MPLQTHQTNIFVGEDKTVIAELFNNGFVITRLPPATVQPPTPTVGALPFKVAEVTQKSQYSFETTCYTSRQLVFDSRGIIMIEGMSTQIIQFDYKAKF